MNNDSASRRVQSSVVERITWIGFVLFFIVAWVAIAQQIYWVLLSCTVACMILGTLNSWHHFRAMDAVELREARVYLFVLGPKLMLLAIVAYLFSWGLSQIGISALAPYQIRFFVFGCLTFGLGLLSFTLPLILQYKYLKIDFRREEYRELKRQVDRELQETARAILTHKDSGTEDSTARRLRVERLLEGLFLISYKEELESQMNLNYLHYLAPLVGPIAALVLFVAQRLSGR